MLHHGMRVSLLGPHTVISAGLQKGSGGTGTGNYLDSNACAPVCDHKDKQSRCPQREGSADNKLPILQRSVGKNELNGPL